MIRLLPSFVGSKSYWVNRLSKYYGEYFVELFAGSAIISINLASRAMLNDNDYYIYLILSNYDKLIVPKVFTKDDYFFYRKRDDWWKYIYCLQKMSFSGVFRYSKNGYNVPIKNDIDKVFPRNDYLVALKKYKQLSPIVLNKDYNNVYIRNIEDAIIVFDPPYEGGKASYNKNFDYHFYWEYIYQLEGMAKKIIVFDYLDNMPFKNIYTKKIRVNGKRKGNIECMFIFDDSLKKGQKGEDIFYNNYKKYVERLDGIKHDFKVKNRNVFIELKSDYYDCNRTDNFFMERWSAKKRMIDGGPWQALKNNNDYFIYFFVKNNKLFIFKTNELVDRLNKLIDTLPEIEIVNQDWITTGFKINRNLLQDIYKEKIIDV